MVQNKDHVKKNLQASQEMVKEMYDQKTTLTGYHEDQKVLLLKPLCPRAFEAL